MRHTKTLFLVFLLISGTIFGQTKDLSVGSSNNGMQQRQGGYYDYSQPNTLNMEVAVWGFVKYPGKYLVPVNTTVIDLISYAGGPNEDAELEDIRLYRVDSDTRKESIITYDYNKLLWNENMTENNLQSSDLQASDVVAVTGGQRLYFKDWTTITLAIFSTLISLAILILNITE